MGVRERHAYVKTFFETGSGGMAKTYGYIIGQLVPSLSSYVVIISFLEEGLTRALAL
jgi:hypothetical protein